MSLLKKVLSTVALASALTLGSGCVFKYWEPREGKIIPNHNWVVFAQYHYTMHIPEKDLEKKLLEIDENEEFEENYAIQDAVLRRLQVLAEAAKRIDESVKSANPQIPWNKINGLRNAIIHDYDEIDMKAIWETVTIDLPKTKMDFIKLKKSLST